MTYLVFIFAIALGGLAGFFIARFSKIKELIAKDATIQAKDAELRAKDQEIAVEKRALEERAKDIEQIEARFKAVASDVMRTHSKDFLTEFERVRTLHNQTIESKEKGFEKIAEGVSKSIESVEKKIANFEKERGEQFGALGSSIKNVLDAGIKMQETATSLKTVLSSASAVRGRWGETVLKNLLEESGLTEGIDFHIQETITGDEAARLRPDVVINLPGGLQLAIDSKAGLEEYFRAVEEKDDEKKREHLSKFSQNLRGHIKALSSKEYQKHLDERIPYVVMFVPGEAAIRAVFEHDTNLYREAQEKKVMLASPATIMPLVLLIAHAWRQHKSVENASKLANEVIDLGARLKTFIGHVAGIGGSLSKATEKFNQAASSWDTRVVPKIETINNLGGQLQIEAEAIQPIEAEPRLPAKATPLIEEDKKQKMPTV